MLDDFGWYENIECSDGDDIVSPIAQKLQYLNDNSVPPVYLSNT